MLVHARRRQRTSGGVKYAEISGFLSFSRRKNKKDTFPASEAEMMVKSSIKEMLTRLTPPNPPPQNTLTQSNSDTWSQGLTFPPENINR